MNANVRFGGGGGKGGGTCGGKGSFKTELHVKAATHHWAHISDSVAVEYHGYVENIMATMAHKR